MRPIIGKSGFTLVELTVVLFILALVAHLGTRELARAKGGRMRVAAGRQLDAIASAIFDSNGDGASGFLADMGRLPFASIATNGASLCLAELYRRPEGVGPYEARQATASNLAEGAPAEIADASVWVPCGWGGPYVRLPNGAASLRDPWGNRFENPDDAGLDRLLDASSAPVAATNAPVAAIRHFGSDGADDSARLPVAPEQRDAMAEFPQATASILATFEPGTLEKIVWYQPLNDKITGGVTNILPGASQTVIAGLAPGARFLKVFRLDGTSRIVQVPLRPGRVFALSLEGQQP